MNAGPVEMIVIFLVAFIILGPERVSEVANSLGRITRTLRRSASELTREVANQEINRGGPLISADPAPAPPKKDEPQADEKPSE